MYRGVYLSGGTEMSDKVRARVIGAPFRVWRDGIQVDALPGDVVTIRAEALVGMADRLEPVADETPQEAPQTELPKLGTVAATKAAVEAGELDPALALEAELSGANRRSLIAYLEGVIGGD